MRFQGNGIRTRDSLQSLGTTGWRHSGRLRFVLWIVGPTGNHVLRGNDAVRVRRREPSLHFMRHCLAVADCVIAIQGGADDQRYELLSVDTEPSCWRRFMNRSASTETLKPDLSVVTAAGEFEDSWFCEIDLATESIAGMTY